MTYCILYVTFYNIYYLSFSVLENVVLFSCKSSLRRMQTFLKYFCVVMKHITSCFLAVVFRCLLAVVFSVVFDTVDHGILISHLEKCCSIQESALKLFKLYLTYRRSVALMDFHSHQLLSHRVPQVSILGPILFLCASFHCGPFFNKYGIFFHCFTSNTQIYFKLRIPFSQYIWKKRDCGLWTCWLRWFSWRLSRPVNTLV